jgi:hypothetical protein
MLAFRIVPLIPRRDPVRSGSPVQPDPEALTVRTTDLGEKRGLFPEKPGFGGQYEAHAFIYPVNYSAGLIHTTNSFHLT